MKQLSSLYPIESDLMIASLNNDSRQKMPSSIFFAEVGLNHDGHDVVADAISNGANVIIHTKELVNYNKDITYIKVANLHQTMVTIANKFYDLVLDKLSFIATTGTNGKSSISCLINNIFNIYTKCAYIGTIGIEYDNKVLATPLTTPHPLFLFKAFAQMVQAGVKVVAMEVSSHALIQQRVDYINFDYAIMSNLSYDHLDYHKTMDAYLKAKAILFTTLKKEAIVILNKDDQSYEYLSSVCPNQIYTYGIEKEADLQAYDIEIYKDHTTFKVLYQGKSYLITVNLIALFNVYNLLASLLMALLEGCQMEWLIENVKDLKQIEGRMEQISLPNNIEVIVDFAHTPDGIEKVLLHAQTINQGGLIKVILGSAGGRDYAKRRVFGSLADQYADYLMVTSDDPRFEDSKAIANEIVQDIIKIPYEYEQDRQQAITKVITQAKPNDIILILGKGIEKFMYVLDQKEPYLGDDQVVYMAAHQ
ncbi:MAG: UDP-N-acetylmuramoyl-L-alanyl-D-glutamate--2,6-diaminopimelate ligase [Bacilli bacterium]